MSILLSSSKIEKDILIYKFSQLIYWGTMNKSYAHPVEWGKYFNGYYANRSIEAISRYLALFRDTKKLKENFILEKEIDLEEIKSNKLFYDIADKSIRAKKDNSYKIRKEVEKYLTRVQFSVFEGEIIPSDLRKLKAYLAKVADTELDSIIIYESTRMNYTERVVIGVDKNDGIFTC